MWRTSRTSSRCCTSTRRRCPTRAASVATAAAEARRSPTRSTMSRTRCGRRPPRSRSSRPCGTLRQLLRDRCAGHPGRGHRRVRGAGRGGEIPTNDIELLQGNALGGTVIREHQTRPARIVRRGEVICSSTQGGGGYGDVLEREPARVVDDLRKGTSPTGWRATSTAWPTTRSCIGRRGRDRAPACGGASGAAAARQTGRSSTLSGTS